MSVQLETWTAEIHIMEPTDGGKDGQIDGQTDERTHG